MGGTWEHARKGGTLMYFKIIVVGKDNPNKNTLKIKIYRLNLVFIKKI